MKAIIVEDEFPAQEELKYLIETHSSIQVTNCFEDGLDVLKIFFTRKMIQMLFFS
ncbi:hypothetical protein GCM10020331_020430 [Ectobacillus funiculus]